MTKTAAALVPSKTTLQDLALDQLAPHPDNVRHDLGDLTDIAASIASKGVLEPLLVLPPDADGVHLVVAGHRRLAAAHRAKPSPVTVPCVIREMTEAEVVEAMLVENLQRAEITAVEEARGYGRLVELGSTVASIAKKVGRTQVLVKGRLALLQLPDRLLELVGDGTLTLGHASELVDHAADDEAMEWIADQIAGARLSRWQSPANAAAIHIENREAKAAMDEALAKLERAGRRRFTPPGGYWFAPDELQLGRPCAVTTLKLPDGGARKHTSEPCHSVHVAQGRDRKVVTTTVCENPRRHTTSGPADDRSTLQMHPATYTGKIPGVDDDPEEAARQAAREERRAADARQAESAVAAVAGVRSLADPLLQELLVQALGEWVAFYSSGDSLGEVVRLLGGPDQTLALLEHRDPADTPKLLAALAVGAAIDNNRIHTPWTDPDVRALHEWLLAHGHTPTGPESTLLEEARNAPPSESGPLFALAEHAMALADELGTTDPDPVRTCASCGCTDDHACAGGCSWAGEDPEGRPLCSQCTDGPGADAG